MDIQDLPYAMLWSTSSGRETICIKRDQLAVFPFGGQCQDASEVLAAEVKATHGNINYEELRGYLDDSGIECVEGMDEDSVLEYAVFMAACDIYDYDTDQINNSGVDEEQYAEYLRGRQ